MEYVVVRYAERRQVLIDGAPSGWTDETLMVEQGHHEFRLDGPDDYQPPAVTTAVSGTSSLSPLQVAFVATAHEGPPDDVA